MLTENRKSVRGSITRHLSIAVASAAIAGALASTTSASDGTWQTGGDLNWSSATNWVGGVVPGVADGTFINGDTATFGGTGTLAGATIDTYIAVIDANRNIRNIRFDGINTINYSIGTAAGQALHLTGGGTTEVTANLSNESAAGSPNLVYTIDAPITVHGNSYTFLGNAPQGLPGGGGANTNRQGGLQPRGQITFTGAGASTLFLDGTHNDGHQAQNQIRYALADTIANPVSIIKNGTGTWELSPTIGGLASYHGDTVLNDGWMRLTGTGDGLHKGASANSVYILNGGGIRVSTASTVKGVVFNTPTTTTSLGATVRPMENSGGAVLSILRDSGPGLQLNYTAMPQHAGFSNPMSFIGTVAEQGGIEFNNGGNLYGGFAIGLAATVFDFGSVLRPVDVDRGLEANEFDLRIAGSVAGTGGMVKTGPGRLRLDNVANALSGTVEVREGQLLFNNSNAMTGNPALLVSGGDVRIKGAQIQTFGSVTVTSGIISPSDSASTLSSPTITLNPAAAATATINTLINDNGVTTVTKNGAGTASLGGSNTYTGGTIINAGKLIVDGDANDTIIGGPNVTTVGGADIRGGRLAFDYTGGTSPASQIVPALTASHATNFATGEIKSTTATSSRGLGYSDNGTDTFTVAYALYGDFDLSGNVNFDDLLLLAQNYSTSGKTWSQGDANYDTVVNFDDLLKLAQNYGVSLLVDGSVNVDDSLASSFSADWALALSTVPEPTSLGLLGGLAAISGRRRSVHSR